MPAIGKLPPPTCVTSLKLNGVCVASIAAKVSEQKNILNVSVELL